MGDLAKAAKIRLIRSVNHISTARYGQIAVSTTASRLKNMGNRYWFEFPSILTYEKPPKTLFLTEDDEYEVVEWLPGHEPHCIASTFITENPRGEIGMYVAQSAEVYEGVVPQVKFGTVIVWQGEPVQTTDENGKDVPLGVQSNEAITLAQKKINDVVKAQFQA